MEELNTEYSMGTAPIYNTLKEMFMIDSPMHDTVLINLGTILRNCSSNKSVTDAKKEDKRLGRKSFKPSKILIQEAKEEILKFVEAVCNLLSTNESIAFPAVIVYYADYKKCIPEMFYKPFTESERELALAETMLRGVVHGVTKSGSVNRVNFLEIPMNGKAFPHAILAKEMGSVKSSHRVVMISNHRLDYHIHRHCASFCLIDSYTGNVLEVGDLGKKVFGTEDIPFLASTHALLGDNIDIKTMLGRKEKNNLIEVAKQNRWTAHTEEYIKTALRNMRIAIPFSI